MFWVWVVGMAIHRTPAAEVWGTRGYGDKNCMRGVWVDWVKGSFVNRQGFTAHAALLTGFKLSQLYFFNCGGVGANTLIAKPFASALPV